MNRFVIACCYVLLVLVFGVHHAQAQPVMAPPYAGSQHRILVGVAVEPAVVLSLGYVSDIGAGRLVGLSVGGGVKVPTTVFRNRAWRAHFITAAHWRPEAHWGTTITSKFYLARNHNRAGTMHGLGLELRAAPGYYGTRWSATLDLGWQGTLLAHVRHSAATRATFQDRYPDGRNRTQGPLDGWYSSTAHRFRFGIAGMRTLTSGSVLQVALGGLFALQKQGVLFGFDLGQVPIYFETSMHVGL